MEFQTLNTVILGYSNIKEEALSDFRLDDSKIKVCVEPIMCFYLRFSSSVSFLASSISLNLQIFACLNRK